MSKAIKGFLFVAVIFTAISTGFSILRAQADVEEVEEPVVEQPEDLSYRIYPMNALEILRMQAVEIHPTREDFIKHTTSRADALSDTNIATSLDCEIYRDVITQYDWEDNTAMAVCAAESWGVPGNVNEELHSDAGCYGSIGLFQIACVHGYSRAELSIPERNVAVAYSLYLERGWQPWGVCHDGKVDCGL